MRLFLLTLTINFVSSVLPDNAIPGIQRTHRKLLKRQLSCSDMERKRSQKKSRKQLARELRNLVITIQRDPAAMAQARKLILTCFRIIRFRSSYV